MTLTIEKTIRQAPCLVYQEEAKRPWRDASGNEDVYEELDETAKEFFRAQARYILDRHAKR